MDRRRIPPRGADGDGVPFVRDGFHPDRPREVPDLVCAGDGLSQGIQAAGTAAGPVEHRYITPRRIVGQGSGGPSAAGVPSTSSSSGGYTIFSLIPKFSTGRVRELRIQRYGCRAAVEEENDAVRVGFHTDSQSAFWLIFPPGSPAGRKAAPAVYPRYSVRSRSPIKARPETAHSPAANAQSFSFRDRLSHVGGFPDDDFAASIVDIPDDFTHGRYANMTGKRVLDADDGGGQVASTSERSKERSASAISQSMSRRFRQ